MKKILMVISVVFLMFGCTDAQIASKNLSTASDMFQVDRRIVFYNGITDTYMLTVEGKCSIEPTPAKISVTCKTGDNEYKKHYLGLSDNVTYFAEQLDSLNVSSYRYKVIFKPSVILPDIDVKT
ncbi:beta-sandwich lipoprotein [Shewanella surugensis]|uniref:Lipoprotein n=1 Tax=Shewanella surugensis TaxID=212020 RepID=A0ABT0LA44_9GAMM|nr:hypothetical protein [Shewanella surugensis]MCL1124227.1 hypothetical protein [Shewanella surugensis]